jgi:hypothetical protein
MVQYFDFLCFFAGTPSGISLSLLGRFFVDFVPGFRIASEEPSFISDTPDNTTVTAPVDGVDMLLSSLANEPWPGDERDSMISSTSSSHQENVKPSLCTLNALERCSRRI